MKNDQNFYQKYAVWLRWVAIVIPLGTFFLVGSLIAGQLNGWVERLLYGGCALLFSGLVYALVDRALALGMRQNRLEQQAGQAQKNLEELQNRLSIVMRLNQKLAEAQDERELMQSLLELVGQLAGANAGTYIPLDEWGQPLASVTHGDLPPQAVEDWKAHLEHADVKEICRACQVLRASHGADCPLAGNPFDDSSEIACLPVQRNDQTLGMINLYFAAPARLEPDMRVFLSSLVDEIALAIETIRFRNQELTTLRQIQMVRSPKMDLSSILSHLLDDAQKTLEVDYALLSIKGNGRIPALDIQGKGPLITADLEYLQALIQRVLETRQVVSQVNNQKQNLPDTFGAVLAAPVCLPDGPALGVILVANRKANAFYPRHFRLLETLATQAAQLVENERFLLELEYKAVIEERTRLAREIHDGLAQTLAYLKMQVAQMQTYLNKEEYSRLQEVLRTSHQTLSEAYLDARQSIDFLRITPQGGVQRWMEQLIEDFQETAGVRIQLTVQPGMEEIPPEIQAQLVRVLQEALSNIRKHAFAENVTISLRKWQEDLILEVHDDGKGFSPEDVPSISQYGLRGMRERAELIGADFQIISQPNQGTTVRLRLPNPFEEASV